MSECCPDPDRRVWTRESPWGWKPKIAWTRSSDTGYRRHIVLAGLGRALVIDVFPRGGYDQNPPQP